MREHSFSLGFLLYLIVDAADGVLVGVLEVENFVDRRARLVVKASAKEVKVMRSRILLL